MHVSKCFAVHVLLFDDFVLQGVGCHVKLSEVTTEAASV